MRDIGTIVDLFCGCGGFSLGAELAGFRSIAAVDIEPTLQSGYRRNFPSARVVEGSGLEEAEQIVKESEHGLEAPVGVRVVIRRE